MRTRRAIFISKVSYFYVQWFQVRAEARARDRSPFLAKPGQGYLRVIVKYAF